MRGGFVIRLLYLVIVIHQILVNPSRCVGMVRRNALLLDVVKPPLEVGVLLQEIMVPSIVHFVAMVVDPQVPVMLATVHEPEPKPGIEGVVINDGYRLCGVAAENACLARRSGGDSFLSDRADSLNGSGSVSIEDSVRPLVKTS